MKQKQRIEKRPLWRREIVGNSGAPPNVVVKMQEIELATFFAKLISL